MELHIVAMAEEGEPDKFILYRPLARLAFVGNQAMADLARAVAAAVTATGAIASNRSSQAMAFLEDIGFLQPDPSPPPAQCNEFRPTTAVLLMTNACQLRCVYCYAAAGEAPAEHLTPEQGWAAIDFVCASALAQARPHFEVSFHGGGEPTLAWSVLTTCVAHARGKPLLARIGLTSNGVWSPSQTGYLLEQMDELTLSFDGAPTTQDAKRPFATGRGSAATLLRTIAALDRRSFAYAIRMTPTAPWQRFPEDVRFICEQTGCRTIQVEPAFNTERRGHPQGDAADCRGFADAFLAAHQIAAVAGRTLFYSGARLGLVTDRFCSAPYDALIVTPAGKLVACYEVTDARHPLARLSGLGCYDADGIHIDAVARNRLHSLIAERQAGCRDCFCLYSCAGDCYTRAFGSGAAGHLHYGPRCEMNRAITRGLLLAAIARGEGVWRRDDPGVAPGMRADAEHGDTFMLSSDAPPKEMALTAAAPSAEGRSPHPSVQGARITAMRSPLVVTSWWSNSLGLTCLHRLAEHPVRRPIYLIQAGKSAEQKARFRAGMPPGVIELAYPDELPADDSKMREYLALALLRELPGAWFIDHDAFFHEDPEPWFCRADIWLGASDACLCIGEPRDGPGITQPAYWLSPRRWPNGIASFDPVPFREKPHVRRPDLLRTDGDLMQPLKDTLVQAWEELAACGLAGWFPLAAESATKHALPAFPSHTHLGGLHVYTNPTPTGGVDDWTAATVAAFDAFFAACPPAWLAIEEPELLRRHAEFRAALA